MYNQNHFHITSQGYQLLKYFMMAFFCAALIGNVGCKSKKKITETPPPANVEVNQLEEAKALLERILASGQSQTWAELESKEKTLLNVKNMGLSDSKLGMMITEADEKLAKERAFLESRESRMEAERMEKALYSKLEGQFDKIASAGNTSVANALIDQTMEMFSNADTPVFIVISEENGVKDFDRPTTIKKYLNYLKDQQTNRNSIGTISKDATGKIKELELVKK